jgi:replication factor A1
LLLLIQKIYKDDSHCKSGGMHVESLMQIAELSPYSRGVNLKVCVINKGQETEVVSRKDGSVYRVAEALIGDPSACVLMSLWNETIAMVEEGSNYKITNAYITVFKNSMRLNLGRKGTMEKIDEEIQANQDVNMSEKRYESQFNPRR